MLNNTANKWYCYLKIFILEIEPAEAVGKSQTSTKIYKIRTR